MRDYGKVSPAFWIRGSGKALRGDPEAQALALYLVTGPAMNMLGLYYHPFTTLCHEIGFSSDQARAVLERVKAAGFAEYDFDLELVWVPNGAAYQIGDELKEKDYRRGSVLKELRRFGKHPFVSKFLQRYAEPYKLHLPFTRASKSTTAPVDDTDSPYDRESPDSPCIQPLSIAPVRSVTVAEAVTGAVAGSLSDTTPPAVVEEQEAGTNPHPKQPDSAAMLVRFYESNHEQLWHEFGIKGPWLRLSADEQRDASAVIHSAPNHWQKALRAQFEHFAFSVGSPGWLKRNLREALAVAADPTVKAPRVKPNAEPPRSHPPPVEEVLARVRGATTTNHQEVA